MFIEILLAIILGVFAGIITGLIPGIHINLISILVFSYSSVLIGMGVDILLLCVFIISMAITHTFLDSIPGIYLGAPDPSMALSALPGHRMLIKGIGHNAVVYTLIGSYFSLLICVLFFPLAIISMKFIYPIIKDFTGYMLIVVVLFLIFRENKKLFAFAVVFLSGSYGLIVLNMNLKQPLFHLLSGLFGVSILIMSLSSESDLPKQKYQKLKIEKKLLTKVVGISSFFGFVSGFLPGVGSSQSAIIAQQTTGDIGDEGFLTLVGGINTAGMIISVATAFALDKARNGAIIVIKKMVDFDLGLITILIISGLISGSLALIIGLKISKKFSKLISRIDYQKIVIFVLCFIFLLSFYFDSFIGILILIGASSLGIYTSLKGIGKNHLMGCLLIPTILYFIL